MTAGLCLDGIRVRNETVIRIETVLIEREDNHCWRARILPTETVEVGDRLRFGDTTESLACFLGFLDAEIIEKKGDTVRLSFQFTGPALDDALSRLGHAPPERS